MEEIKKFKTVEDEWIKWWEDHPGLYMAKDDSTKDKKYVLVEFPYPSGSGLHVGHAFSFTGGDVYARFKRMQGYNVLFPMGWDAFGLPTENYAIKMKRKPQEVTKENTDVFRTQMKRLAFSFDWSREVNTTDPEYYKWTQWIFVQLFKKGLAYKQEMPINWCPSCKIGLANEEVLNGKCERCGADVSRRNISQWVVKITDYADRLIDGLKNTDFIEKVKAAQINWIDRKEWIDITYQIEGTDEVVTIATTRPDTNFGATFVVLAPEHDLVTKLMSGDIKTSENLDVIREYVRSAKNKSELDRQKEVMGRDKSGVYTGLQAKNQLTGENMPIWITDFVLSSVGTGAVVGVPGHDIRDFEFAKQFGMTIVRVVVGKDGKTGEIIAKEDVQEEEGTMINSGFLNGMDIHEATTKVMDYLEEKGWGKRSIRYHLRDWIFSRQHYWGEPIPMVDCAKCGWVPEKEENLPIVLPEVEAYEPTDDGLSPLSRIDSFVKCKCPECGEEASRETDTMPNWAGSDWYFLRYMDPHNTTKLVDFDLLKKWGPVDIYIGGDEHNTLHLLYSRFIYQFLYDQGIFPKELPEPYYKRVSHGVILGPDNQRMSKSKGNVIVPESVADMYGVDVVRMYLMFMGPFEGTMAWNEKTLMGVKRFVAKFEDAIEKLNNEVTLSSMFLSNQSDYPEILPVLNKTIAKVTKDIEQFGYNTAIASLMELLNTLQRTRLGESTIPTDVGHRWLMVLDRSNAKKIVTMLAPFAPYVSEELWSKIREQVDAESVHAASWPVADPSYLIDEQVTVVVAINGKLRDQLLVDREKANDENAMLELARGSEKIKTWLEGKQVVKEIFVPGRMVNIVAA